MSTKTLILTVLPESEAKAVKSIFSLNQVSEKNDGKYPVFQACYGNNSVIISCIINKGNTDAAIATIDLIEMYKPDNAILIGTCAGRPDQTHIGDVVVSSLGIYDYGQSTLKDKHDVRLNGLTPTDVLARGFSFLKSDKDLNKNWWSLIFKHAIDFGITDFNEIKVTLFSKAIASGSQIINEQSMSILTEANNNIYAADQDSAGFASSCIDRGIKWIVVRGVSDCGDRDTRKNKAILATLSAAALVKLYLDKNKVTVSENGAPGESPYPSPELSNTLSSLMGCSHIWVPVNGRETLENNARNEMKIKAIKEGSGSPIRLLAHTGYSYLCNRGIFYNQVQKHLEKGGAFNVLLTDPYCEDIVLNRTDREHIKAKYSMAFLGYNRLKSQFADQINLKTIRYNLTATILITNRMAFFEPYIHTAAQRDRLLFVTFEMLFDKNIALHGYELMLKYFTNLFSHGQEYNSAEEVE